MALQDLITEMNEAKGEARADAPPQTPPPTVPQTPPAAKDDTPPAPPKAPETKAPETPPAQPKAQPAQTIPKDPPFVKQPKETPPTQEGTPPATLGAPVLEPGPDVFSTRLSELTAGKVKNDKDLTRFLERQAQLEVEAEKGFQPKFKDERAKLVHQLITENPGKEPEALMRTLRAISFNQEGKTAKDVLFEGYLLDPKNSDLTPLRAQELFEIEYAEKYDDIENNPLKKRELELAVRASNEAINKIQSDFKAPEAKAEEINKEVVSAVSAAVQNFGGVRLSFTDNPQETDYLNVAIENPQELQAIQNEILNPAQAYNEFLAEFGDFKTKEDYDKLTREVYERRNHRQLRMEAFKHGAKLERIKVINEMRNASNPRDVSHAGTPAPAGKTSFLQAWENAENAKKTG